MQFAYRSLWQRNKIKQKAEVAQSDAIQQIIIQARYKHLFSTDLAHYLEIIEFYAVSDSYFLEICIQSFTVPNPQFSLNFGEFGYCSKYHRLGCPRISSPIQGVAKNQSTLVILRLHFLRTLEK